MKCQIAKIAEGGISSPYSFPGTAMFAQDLPPHGTHYFNSLLSHR
ncbi:hypothetical protein [Nostoc sp. 'Peltigera membranacea cyanobiont' 232]|nr:hypothetical protein [Nostoc sp. 'Peltigera membranacea cyanobiont' 232]